jgi:hypothetical protein
MGGIGQTKSALCEDTSKNENLKRCTLYCFVDSTRALTQSRMVHAIFMIPRK